MEKEIKSYSELSLAVRVQLSPAEKEGLTDIVFSNTQLPIRFEIGTSRLTLLTAIQQAVRDYTASFISATQTFKRIQIRFDRCTFVGELVVDQVDAFFKSLVFQDCSVQSIKVVTPAKFSFLITSSKVGTLSLRPETGQLLAKLTIKDSVVDEIHAESISFKRNFIVENSSIGAEDEEGIALIIFDGSTFFSSCLFLGVSFLKAPFFHGADFKRDVNFINCTFKDTKKRSSLAAYRVLRKVASNAGADYEGQLFHSLELRTRYNVDLPKGRQIFASKQGVETIASFVMSRLNDYGQDLWKPLYWLFVGGLLFFILYLLGGQVGCILPQKETPKWILNVCPRWTEFLYAVRNAFGPFGLVLSADQIQPNTATVKILGFIHQLISSIIWFIWILQIRSRFKL